MGVRHPHGHIQGKWKFELEYLECEYDIEQPIGLPPDRLILSAFNFPFPAASEGRTYLANIVYPLSYTREVVDSLTCYSDCGYMDSDLATASESVQWVDGGDGVLLDRVNFLST